MTTAPGSSSQTQSGRISDIEAGLNAFKQGDYATAIVLLEPALAASSEDPLIARAQMGLAIAYEKLGETEQAAQICRSLCHSANAQVQDWAIKTSASLLKRHPELASSETTLHQPSQPSNYKGDECSEADPSQIASHGPTPAPAVEPTGFTLLTAHPPAATYSSATHPPATDSPATTPSDWTNAARDRFFPSRLDAVGSVSPHSEVEAPVPTPSLYQPVWRQAERAQTWKSLGQVNPLRLVVVQVVTAIALFLAVQQVFYWIIAGYGNAVIKILPKLGFRVVQPGAPTWTISVTLLLLLVLLVSSRWLLDGLLTVMYGLKPLSLSALAAHSPEAGRSLSQFCRKKNLPLPALGVLPTNAPIIFSYGFIPHISRVVVSQGLLEQLADDEIAAVYANEVGHLAHWTVPLMSAAIVVLQIPYTLYRVISEWGNQKQAAVSKASATLISVLSYGLFWLWRWVPLWLSRQRAYYSDRVAVDLTGNPNGYARALLKIAIGTANDVQQQGQTSYLLEGFEVLTPLGYRAATPIGSLYPHTPLEPILEWERGNPYRHWLAVNNTHPPTGERLNLLMLYARHWRLAGELDWQDSPRKTSLSGRQWRTLLLQGAPYFGVIFGLALAVLLSGIGTIGLRAGWQAVSWMARDRTIWWGLPLVGFCLGAIIRVNPFFPDIGSQTPGGANNSALPGLLKNHSNIPINSQPAQLEGKLLGRSGISNALNQDLLLQTSTGIVKLHSTSRFGFLSSLLPRSTRPADLAKQSLLATGWFRRGLTPWIDIETLRTTGGRTSRSYHPIWTVVAATIAAGLGILTILKL